MTVFSVVVDGLNTSQMRLRPTRPEMARTVARTPVPTMTVFPMTKPKSKSQNVNHR